MYPYYNTGIVHTPESVRDGIAENFNPDLNGKPNKGVLVANKGGASKTRTFILPSNPTGNMPGDSIQITIPARTVVILPLRIYALDLSDLNGVAQTDIVLLH